MKTSEITAVSTQCAGRTVAAVEWEENEPHFRLDVLRIRFEDGSALEVDVDYVERIKVIGPIQPPGTMWRPIATAPTDGTLVDLWVAGPRNAGARETDCWFERGAWWRDYGRDGPLKPGSFVDDVPTHWMPLPASPIEPSGSNPGVETVLHNERKGALMSSPLAPVLRPLQIDPSKELLNVPTRRICTFNVQLRRGGSLLNVRLSGVASPESLSDIPAFLGAAADALDGDRNPIVSINLVRPFEGVKAVTCLVRTPPDNHLAEVCIEGSDVPANEADVPAFLRYLVTVFTDNGIRANQ